MTEFKGNQTYTEVLETLKNNHPIVLEERKNEWGQHVSMRELSFISGKWKITTVICKKSRMLGLGHCACTGHSPFYKRTIDRKEALKIIKKYLIKKKFAS